MNNGLDSDLNIDRQVKWGNFLVSYPLRIKKTDVRKVKKLEFENYEKTYVDNFGLFFLVFLKSISGLLPYLFIFVYFFLFSANN